MSALSNRINNLSESATIKMAKMGRELSAKGVDVINLSFGEPDFNTPKHIKEAAKKAMDDNFTYYYLSFQHFTYRFVIVLNKSIYLFIVSLSFLK